MKLCRVVAYLCRAAGTLTIGMVPVSLDDGSSPVLLHGGGLESARISASQTLLYGQARRIVVPTQPGAGTRSGRGRGPALPLLTLTIVGQGWVWAPRRAVGSTTPSRAERAAPASGAMPARCASRLPSATRYSSSARSARLAVPASGDEAPEAGVLRSFGCFVVAAGCCMVQRDPTYLHLLEEMNGRHPSGTARIHLGRIGSQTLPCASRASMSGATRRRPSRQSTPAARITAGRVRRMAAARS